MKKMEAAEAKKLMLEKLDKVGGGEGRRGEEDVMRISNSHCH